MFLTGELLILTHDLSVAEALHISADVRSVKMNFSRPQLLLRPEEQEVAAAIWRANATALLPLVYVVPALALNAFLIVLLRMHFRGAPFFSLYAFTTLVDCGEWMALYVIFR